MKSGILVLYIRLEYLNSMIFSIANNDFAVKWYLNPFDAHELTALTTGRAEFTHIRIVTGPKYLNARIARISYQYKTLSIFGIIWVLEKKNHDKCLNKKFIQSTLRYAPGMFELTLMWTFTSKTQLKITIWILINLIKINLKIGNQLNFFFRLYFVLDIYR